MRDINWDAVTDWSASCSAIAREIGCYANTVASEKRKRGLDVSHRGRPKDFLSDQWESVNWGESNRILAKQFGISNQAVSHARKRLTNTKSIYGKVYFNDGTPWEDLIV